MTHDTAFLGFFVDFINEDQATKTVYKLGLFLSISSLGMDTFIIRPVLLIVARMVVNMGLHADGKTTADHRSGDRGSFTVASSVSGKENKPVS